MPLRMRELALAAIISTSLPLPSFSAEAVNSVVGYDQYRKVSTIVTDSFPVPDVGSFLAPAFARASVRGFVADSGVESMQIFVYYSGDGWKFFSSAVDIDGQALPFTPIDRQVNRATNITEQFAAELTRPYLLAHRATGLDMRFDGKNGSLVVKLPPTFVQSFLAKLEEIEAATRIAISKKATTNAPNKVKLGVTYVPVIDSLAQKLQLPATHGVMVMIAPPGSPAASGGIQTGDVLVNLNGKPIANTLTGLQDAMGAVELGSSANFTIWREGKSMELRIQF